MRRSARYGLTIAVAGIICAAGAGVAFIAARPAGADSSPCHMQHSCPSDHHSYDWTDPRTGLTWNCARPGATEYDPSLDTTTIVWDSLAYYCRPAGAARPATTTAKTTTARTTTARTTTTALPGTPANVGRTVRLHPRTQTSHCTRGPLPDPQCSPGAIYSGLTKPVICAPTFRTGTIRNVPDSLKHAVEIAYGMTPKSYGRTIEIDHIVSLQLGGSNDIANLFPEPGSGAATYRDKDRLENRLHHLVCEHGSMTLSAAQHQIATNWISLYNRVYSTAP